MFWFLLPLGGSFSRVDKVETREVQPNWAVKTVNGQDVTGLVLEASGFEDPLQQ